MASARQPPGRSRSGVRRVRVDARSAVLVGEPGAPEPAALGGRRLPVLLDEIRACGACATKLPHGPRPILAASATAPLSCTDSRSTRRIVTTPVPVR